MPLGMHVRIICSISPDTSLSQGKERWQANVVDARKAV